MENDNMPSAAAALQLQGVDAFIEAAWTFARQWMNDSAGVPSAMLLGRYADEELLFVFPSGQDRDAFAKSCEAEAATFGADVAMFAQEAFVGTGEEGVASIECVTLHWRERGQPTRAQFAPIVREALVPQLGPVSSLPGEHRNEFLDRVFGFVRH